jgi:spore coat protein U-like protein
MKMKKLVGLAMVLGLVLALSGAAMAGDSTTVAVSANVVGTCKFLSGGTMAFGNLDPSVGGDKNATVTQPTFWCTKGASYTITDDKGLYESGTTFRVKHASLAEYIPYTFTYTSSGTGSGPGSPINMNIAGTITSADYLNASAGSYADTVTLTIAP